MMGRTSDKIGAVYTQQVYDMQIVGLTAGFSVSKTGVRYAGGRKRPSFGGNHGQSQSLRRQDPDIY